MTFLTLFRHVAERAFRLPLAGALALAAAPAGAQIMLTAPQAISRVDRPLFASPMIDPAPVLPKKMETPAPPPVVAEPQAPATPRATLLRHLPNNIQGYRLIGEIGASEWPFYLTDKQARRRLRFQLGYLSAVSVMPEVSRLTLSINDQIVGATPLTAVQSVKTVVFDIPPGLLRPGFNSVRLAGNQRHRVDCSLEATQELWTQIDPTQTGFILDEADAAVEAIADLGALPADEQGALPLRAVIDGKPSTRVVERMLRVAQLVSIIGRFEQPVVDVGGVASGRYGANLFVGAAAELAPLIGADVLGAVTKPRAFVLPATPQRRAAIVVTAADSRQVDEAIRQFLVAAKPSGARAGLRAAAAFPGFRVDGGQRIRLGDIGVRSAEFDGRLFRTAFNIIMPPDFYSADYGRATVRLAGGYAPGLAQKAQLVMNVNERTAVSLPLLRASGDVFHDNPLPVPLGFLRPGLNRIEIEAHVPAPSDKSCDPLSARDAPGRFLFLDSTEIEIPQIARVGRLPDLAVTATGGFPFAAAPRRSKLYMPRLDAKTIGAAATFVAHLAISAGRPIDFEITEQPPARGGAPTLAVAPYDALDPDLLRKLDMPVEDLTRVWREKFGVEKTGRQMSDAVGVDEATRNRLVLQNNFPMACHPPQSLGSLRAMLRNVDRVVTGALGEIEPAATAAGGEEDGVPDLFREWNARLRGENRLEKLIDRARDLLEFGKAKFTDAGDLFRRFDTAPPQTSSGTSLALGQNLMDGASDNVWTVLTAPNADALADSVACLVDPRVSRQIAGHVSLLDLSRAKIDVLPAANTHFVVTQPLSVGNARLIAAGWLSLHALYYVAAVLAVGAALAVATRAFVRNVGRRTS